MSASLDHLADPRLQVPSTPFAAVLFDCDGTLVDSMPVHYVAWVEALQAHGAPYEFTEEIFYGHAGIREQDIVAKFNGLHDCQLDPDAVAELKMEKFHQHIPEMKSIAPVEAFARGVHGTLPIGVVSGSEEETVRGCLEATGMLDLFGTIVTPRRVQRGKPAPDMFLLAAEELGVPAEQCLVVEDGQSGIDAATAAGMASVFVGRDLR